MDTIAHGCGAWEASSPLLPSDGLIVAVAFHARCHSYANGRFELVIGGRLSGQMMVIPGQIRRFMQNGDVLIHRWGGAARGRGRLRSRRMGSPGTATRLCDAFLRVVNPLNVALFRLLKEPQVSVMRFCEE